MAFERVETETGNGVDADCMAISAIEASRVRRADDGGLNSTPEFHRTWHRQPGTGANGVIGLPPYAPSPSLRRLPSLFLVIFTALLSPWSPIALNVKLPQDGATRGESQKD